MTDFSAIVYQSEIDQTSDDESNCCSPPQMKLSRNVVNICVYRASEDVFYKDINLPVLDIERHYQLDQENSVANNSGIFQETSKKKLVGRVRASRIQPIG